ncbi:hypothetical protein HDU76_004019, partial [Blyttiomyces sp. JEL0837]
MGQRISRGEGSPQVPDSLDQRQLACEFTAPSQLNPSSATPVPSKFTPSTASTSSIQSTSTAQPEATKLMPSANDLDNDKHELRTSTSLHDDST